MQRYTKLLLLPLVLIAGCGNPDTTAARTPADVSAPDLQAAVADADVRSFYEKHGWQAVWSTSSAEQLEDALSRRERHGLERVGFLQGPSGSPATREAALTRAAMRYARALAQGLLNPEEHYDIYTIPRPAADLEAGLYAALKDNRVGEWLAGLAPSDASYEAISEAYLRLRESNESSLEAISGGELIREGDRSSRVPAIREALIRNGYLQGSSGAATSAEADLYTARIKQAVERLQEDRGIRPDGVVGPDTLQALNTGAGDRARAAAVALERRRWLRRDPASDRIDVNTAAAVLEYYRDGRVVDRRKVVVGQPGWKTPQLQAPMYRLVANPTWTVPRSIEREELGDVSSGYLRSRNMVRRDGWIVQLPGPENALGLVKFDMQNEYAIYLHDTPSKSLFERNLRQLSHGCIRVENALGFASMLAEDQGITAKWQNARQTGEETFVPLTRHIPVRLLYHPTYVDPEGEVRFEQDLYGWNEWIGQKLGFAKSVSISAAPKGDGGIGP